MRLNHKFVELVQNMGDNSNPEIKEVFDHIKAGNLKSAESVCTDRLLKDDGDRTFVKMLSNIYLVQGRPRRAMRLLELATEIHGGAHDLEQALGIALAGCRNFSGAREKLISCLLSEGLSRKGLVCLARVMIETGKSKMAVGLLSEALSTVDSDPEAIFLLARATKAWSKNDEIYRTILVENMQRTEMVDLYIDLCDSLVNQYRNDEAIECLEMLSECHCNRPQVLERLAVAYHRMGDTDKAIRTLRDLLVEGVSTHVVSMLGSFLREIGKFEEARSFFRQAIELDTYHVRNYFLLAKSGPEPRDAKYFDQLRAFDKEGIVTEPKQKADMYLTFAELSERNGDPATAFQYALQAKRFKRQVVGYDERRALQSITLPLDAHRHRAYSHIRKKLNAQPTPIFIVGMPRSGSTLVDQILTSHSKIWSLGEASILEDVLELGQYAQSVPKYPEQFPKWSNDDIERVRELYIECVQQEMRDRDRGKPFVVDKMLANFRYIGLIEVLFPEAKIIHTRRNPIDTCLSCFMQNFGQLGYTNDLGELGRYYRTYHNAMVAWEERSRGGSIINVFYEETVLNFDRTVRNILNFLDLEFEVSCSNFFETRRPVRTASIMQVRRPIYKDSLTRWRPNGEETGSLMAEIAPLVEEYGSMRGQDARGHFAINLE